MRGGERESRIRISMDRLSMGWGMVTRPGKTRKKKEDTNDTQKKKIRRTRKSKVGRGGKIRRWKGVF